MGRSKIMACPEGNGEPLKGLEQGTDIGIVGTYEDLLANLLLGCGRTAGSSSQYGAAAPCNGGLLPSLQQSPHRSADYLSISSKL